MANVSDTKVNPALNFRQMESSAPSYQYRNIYPANGGSRNILLTSAGELQNTIFNLPVEVDNLGESYLEYTLNIVDQGLVAGNQNIYPWLFKDTYGEFNDILLRDTGSMNIVELRNANLYSNLMNRINTSKKELEYNDDMNGLVVSNAPLTDAKNKRFDNNTASLAFKEPQALQVGTLSTNSTTVYSLSVPRKVYLKDICPDSFFGMAKNSLFPVETYLDINWIGNRLGYGGTSQVDPTAGNQALISQVFTGTILGTYAVCLSGLVLKLAVETNQELIRAMKMEVAKGLTIPIPWVKVHTLQAASAAPYVYNLPLDNKQHGRKIKEIVYAPYAAAPAVGSSYRLYDHCNNAILGTGATVQSVAMNTKVSTYQTSLDNQYLQRDIVQCPISATSQLHDDYAIHKKILKNTCYFNQPIYNNYWFDMDKFAYIDSNDNEEGSVYVDGFDLVKPVNYVVDVKSGTTTAINNVCVVVGQKLLSITSSSYAVI
jgi:hypothetical protein